jgi:hypothetical protein
MGAFISVCADAIRIIFDEHPFFAMQKTNDFFLGMQPKDSEIPSLLKFRILSIQRHLGIAKCSMKLTLIASINVKKIGDCWLVHNSQKS